LSFALKQSRNESSTTLSPRELGVGIASPLRKTATHLPSPVPQSSGVIALPAGVSQAMSRTWSPVRIGLPSKKRRLRKTGWSRRSLVTRRVNSSRSTFFSHIDQSIQDTSESWQ
jgi:hypothetical protein